LVELGVFAAVGEVELGEVEDGVVEDGVVEDGGVVDDGDFVVPAAAVGLVESLVESDAIDLSVEVSAGLAGVGGDAPRGLLGVEGLELGGAWAGDEGGVSFEPQAQSSASEANVAKRASMVVLRGDGSGHLSPLA